MIKAILGTVQTTAATLFFLRAYFIKSITQELSLVISILGTFIATSESEIESMVTNPGSRVQISTIFKVFKCGLIIMTFTFNGNINDYFVSTFFIYSGLIGRMYFRNAGFKSIEVEFSQTDIDFEISPDHMDNKNLSHYFDTIMSKAVTTCVQGIRDKTTQ